MLRLSERWEFVRGAFATRLGSQIDNLRVLLVDVEDVNDNGSDAGRLCQGARRTGAKSVTGWTVARTVRHLVKGSSDDFL
jgi:predicted amidophosphoribosyltransferase